MKKRQSAGEFRPVSINHLNSLKGNCNWYNSSTPGCGTVPDDKNK